MLGVLDVAGLGLVGYCKQVPVFSGRTVCARCRRLGLQLGSLPLLRNGDPRSTCAFATRWAAPSTMSRHNNGIQRTICASETNTLLSVKRSNGKLIDLR